MCNDRRETILEVPKWVTHHMTHLSSLFERLDEGDLQECHEDTCLNGDILVQEVGQGGMNLSNPFCEHQLRC